MRALLRLAAVSCMVLAPVAASAEAAGAASDATLRREIIGSWAKDAAACTTDVVSFSESGIVTAQGHDAATGTFQIKDGKIVGIFEGKTLTQGLEIRGDAMTVLDGSGNVARTLVRCASRPAPAVGTPPADADLRHGILGAWSESAAKCATDTMTFSEGGAVALAGGPPATGSYAIKDGSVIVTMTTGGKTQTIRALIEGDSLKGFDEAGKPVGVLVRCAASRPAATGGTPTNTDLRDGIVGRWAISSEKCLTDFAIFSEDGDIAVMGRDTATGSFTIKDGSITMTITAGSKIQTTGARVKGDVLEGFDAAGKSVGRLVRCTNLPGAGQGAAAALPPDNIAGPPLFTSIRTIVDKAVGEQRTFLNCSRTAPAEYALVLSAWKRDVEAASALISANDTAKPYLPELEYKTDPRHILLEGEPFQKIIDLCNANEHWQEDFTRLNFTLLQPKIAQLLGGP